jgi:hypothetical protein
VRLELIENPLVRLDAEDSGRLERTPQDIRIRPGLVGLNDAEALLFIEKLDSSRCHGLVSLLPANARGRVRNASRFSLFKTNSDGFQPRSRPLRQARKARAN